ncbi:23S rRNA (guanosine(2251)-2'-O)-methyltransferase RlmB [Candidatus Poribacteria bacterium]|nr:23S rRNA (guanosine(2251)-2'-O)-methyltransferase RlmB [Candidatus Poribacteria bacterium]
MEPIFGRNTVREALRAHPERVAKLILARGSKDTAAQELVDLASAAGVPHESAERSRIDRLAHGGNHQGVVALVRGASYAELDDLIDETSAATDALVVLLDHIQDPHNLGAIIRTAEAAGARAVVVPKRGAAPVTPAVAKASAGATEYLPVVRVANIVQSIQRLQETGYWVVGATSTEAPNAIPYTGYDFRGKCALVIGSEGEGLARLVAEACDTLVHIPMYGRIESLNASVSAGILLYEAVRQRQEPNS